MQASKKKESSRKFTRAAKHVGFTSLLLGSVLVGMQLSVPSNELGGTSSVPVTMSFVSDGGLAGSYLAGRQALSANDFTDASNYILNAMEYDPRNIELLNEALHLQLIAGKMHKALRIAERMDALDPGHPVATMTRIVWYMKEGKPEKAALLLSEEDNQELYGSLHPVIEAWVALANQTPSEAISLKDAIAESGFISPFLYYQQALLNDVAGFHDAAEQSYAEASSNLRATPFRLVQARANYLQRMRHVQAADALMQDYAEENPGSHFVAAWLTQQNAQGETVTPIVADAQQGMAELLFTSASILYGQQALQEAMVYLQLALSLNESLAPAQFMLASIYEEMKQYDKAIAIYGDIGKDSVFYRRAQIRMALNYEGLKQEDKAIECLKQLIAEWPEDEDPYASLGDIYRVKKQYSEAIDTYSDALKYAQTEAAQWSLYYARGIAYERMGEWKKAEADFREALLLEPNQPDVLNYLGYSWLERGQEPVLAREYIAKALEERPRSAHIIDSMGWAYYLSGEFEKAVEYLEQAADLRPQDVTINEHLGDAYWRVGRRIEAQFQWERALSFDPTEEEEEQIRLKISEGMKPFESPIQHSSKTAKPLASCGEEC